MQFLHQNFGYIADPHGAIGWLGLQDYQNLNSEPITGVFLETAHPAKFLDVVEDTLDFTVSIPEKIQGILTQPKQATAISNYEDLKSFLLDRA